MNCAKKHISRTSWMRRGSVFAVVFSLVACLLGSAGASENGEPLMRSDLALAGLLPSSPNICAKSACELPNFSNAAGTVNMFAPKLVRGVVDWVLVLASTDQASVAWCQAALLLNNSRVVEPQAYIALSSEDKTSCLGGDDNYCPQLYFTQIDGQGDVYFYLLHRNHLRARGAGAANAAGNFVFDFTKADIKPSACGADSCLAAGDLNDDNVINDKDVKLFLSLQERSQFSYAPADANLDGVVNVEDVIAGVSPNLEKTGDASPSVCADATNP